MRIGVVVVAALAAAAVAEAEESMSSADPRLFAEPRADESPTPYACTADTLVSGTRCYFESTAPAAADPARQAVENAATAARLADRACQHAARHPLDPIPDPEVLAWCKRTFAEKAAACGADGSRPVLDGEGRFGGEFRLCYAALSEVLARAQTTARTSAPCCRCLVAEKCAASADRCNADALSRLLDGAAARCAEERCRDACRALVPAPPPRQETSRTAPPKGPAPCFDPLRPEMPCAYY
jgi:hypothetical protein